MLRLYDNNGRLYEGEDYETILENMHFGLMVEEDMLESLVRMIGMTGDLQQLFELWDALKYDAVDILPPRLLIKALERWTARVQEIKDRDLCEACGLPPGKWGAVA